MGLERYKEDYRDNGRNLNIEYRGEQHWVNIKFPDLDNCTTVTEENTLVLRKHTDILRGKGHDASK